MMTNAQLDNEKQALVYTVEDLKVCTTSIWFPKDTFLVFT